MKSFLLVILLLAASTVSGQQYDDYQQQQQEPGQGGYQENTQENENAAGGGNSVDSSGPLDPSIPEPPSQIPETSFVCDGKPYDPGMYADEETGCRVYHMCYRGKKESFICGTGTIFNQEILSCDYPEKVDCSASPSFYEANSELGKSSPEPSNQGNQGNQGSSGKPRPAAGQQPEFGGADDAEQPAQRPGNGGNGGGDYESPRGAARPRTPAVRPPPPPSGPRPSQGGYEPAQGGVDQPNYRPNAPGPAPRPRAKTNQPRQPAAGQPNYRPAAGGAVDRPAARPAGKANRPRPVDRPVVQENDQVLDYEPSQIVQQRVNRQAYARQQRAFARRSGRWQVMSTAY